MKFTRNSVTVHGKMAEILSSFSDDDWAFLDYSGSIADQIASLMERQGVNKAELARKLGKSRAYVTKVLSGDANLTMRTFLSILGALDARAETKILPKGNHGVWFEVVTNPKHGLGHVLPRRFPGAHKASDGMCGSIADLKPNAA